MAAAGSVLNVVDRIAEICEARIECPQHAPEGAPADIELSALHPGDVRVVGAGAYANLALRQARPFTERAQRSAEDELVSARPNTVLDYEWQLRVHLLPFFKNHRLSQITVAEDDRYREAKVVEAAATRGKPIMDE